VARISDLRLLAAVLVASLLLLAAPPARAQFTAAMPDCTGMGSVKVDGSSSRHKYSFALICDTLSSNVQAAYDHGTGKASEKLTGDGWSYTSQWNCADDPWVAAVPVACGNPKIAMKGIVALGQMAATLGYPLSAYSLSDQNRHVLAAQLNNALNMAPSAAPPSSVKNDKLLQKVQGPDRSKVLKQASAAADLTVVRIDGPTTLAAGESATFSFIVGNIGDANATVEVNLLFAGSLMQTGQVSADSGLSCDTAPSSGKVNSNLHCTGAQLTPQRSATITVHAVGMNPGPGALIASINNSRSLSERNYDNNTGRRDVTVQ
jgi:hypothetical protein